MKLLENENINLQYANWLSILIELIQPKNLFVVAGRGTAKTSELMAQRAMNICYDMPHAQIALVSDTYANALKNVIPTLLEGFERKGWKLGTHYVLDQRPPDFFKKCYKPTNDFKHTISTITGDRFLVGSLDQPSGLAGNSVQHLLGDESRLLNPEKLKRIIPAIRGEYVQFNHSIYYRGQTFFTDMPNILSGDYDWILQREKEMNIQQIECAFELGKLVNNTKIKIINANEKNKPYLVQKYQSELANWTIKWHRVRKDSTFFYVASSFVNADILTAGFFKDSLKSLGYEEFKSAILSLQVNISAGDRFYTHLGHHHFYEDGIINEYYKRFALGEKVIQSSEALRYIKHNQKLEGGMDFGNMSSLVIAQHQRTINSPGYLYVLKEFYTLPPDSIRELADTFLSFFQFHKVKVLDLYYDRSMNAYQKIKRDVATDVKKNIEYYKNGTPTGWKVNLMSEYKTKILHEEEYNFARSFLGGFEKENPRVLIDKLQCKCLKSSLELTKTIVKSESGSGSKSIHKNKTSEKMPLHQLPMNSTNFSDAFKYLIYRKIFVQKTQKRGITTISGVDVF